MSGYKHHDGGRAAAGFRGTTGDCVVRAIAIATGRKYKTVYNWMQKDKREWYTGQGLSASRLTRYSQPGRGITSGHYGPYLRCAGWHKVPSHMGDWCIGDTVADVANKYKGVTVVVRSQRPRQQRRHHLCCIKRGTVLDTWDCRESLVKAVYLKRPKAR